MTAAIFGLIGVIVGGLVTGGVQIWVEHLRKRGELRIAKRLVDSELHSVALDLGRLATDGITPAEWRKEQLLPSSAWREHRAILAELPDADWEQLYVVYDGIEAMRPKIQAAPPDLPLTPDFRQTSAGLLHLVEALREQLKS
jgi:hypothetical protein